MVITLTGQKLELMCDPSTTGHQLFEAVITHIELPEFFFFGLTYVAGNISFTPKFIYFETAPNLIVVWLITQIQTDVTGGRKHQKKFSSSQSALANI